MSMAGEEIACQIMLSDGVKAITLQFGIGCVLLEAVKNSVSMGNKIPLIRV